MNIVSFSDPTLNSNQKIGIIHKKIQDLRKTYNHLKAELASIDRRRKKLRRRDRETKKNLMKSQTVNWVAIIIKYLNRRSWTDYVSELKQNCILYNLRIHNLQKNVYRRIHLSTKK